MRRGSALFIAVGFLAASCTRDTSTPTSRADALSVADAGVVIHLDVQDDVDLTSTGPVRRAPAALTLAFADAGNLAIPRADFAIARYSTYVLLVGGLSAGVPTNDVTSCPIDPRTGIDIDDSTSTSAEFSPRTREMAAVWNDRLYVLGGEDGGGYAYADAYSAPLQRDGTVGNFVPLANLPTARAGGSAVVLDGALYLVGGSPAFTTVLPTLVRAPFAPDGTLGSWTDAGAMLQPLTDGAAVVANDRIYYAGGKDATGAAQTSVQLGALQPDGSLLWTQLNPMTAARSDFALTIADGYLTAVGGAGGLASSEQALILDDGTLGPWISAGLSLPASRQGARAFASGGRVTVLGGLDGTGADTSAVFAGGTSDALPYDAWTSGGPFYASASAGWSQMPDDVGALGGFYLVAGSNDWTITPISSVFRGSFAATGALGPFVDAVGAGAPLTPARYNTAAVVWKGKLWVFGGQTCTPSCGTTYDVSNAPLHADGTLGDFASVATLPITTPNIQVNGGNAFIDHDTLILIPGQGTNTAYSTPMPVVTSSVWTATSMASSGTISEYQAAALMHGEVYVGLPNVDGVEFATLGAATSKSGMGPFSVVAPDAASLYGNSNFGIVYNTDAVGYEGRLYILSGDYGGAPAPALETGLLGDGGIEGWTSFSPMPTGNKAASGVSYNGYLGLVGGANGYNQNMYVFSRSNATGGLSAWALGHPLGSARFQPALAARGADVYAVGGENSSGDVTSGLASIEHGIVGSDGGLSWTATTSLPIALVGAAAVATDDALYVSGGTLGDGGAQTAVYVAAILDGGALGSFASTSPLDSPRTGHAMVTWNGWLYALGGSDGTTALSSVSGAPLTSSGVGAWSPTSGIVPSETLGQNPLRVGMGAVAHGGWVYLLAGSDGTNTTGEIMRAPFLASDGGLGAWQAETSLSVPRDGAGVIADGDRLYVLGGCLDGTVPCGSTDGNLTGPLGDTLSAPFYRDGSLGEWTPMASLQDARAGASATVAAGWLVLAGGSGMTVSTATQVQVSRPFAAASRSRVLRRLDLGQDASVDAVTLEPGGGDSTRTGRFALSARVAPDDGGFSPWFDLGRVAPGETVSPVAAGPVRYLDLRIDLDDALASTVDRGGERNLTNLDVEITPCSGSACGITSSSSGTSSGSTGAATTTGTASSGTSATGGTLSTTGTSSSGTSGTASSSSTGSSSSAAATGSSGGTAAASNGSSTGGDKRDVFGCSSTSGGSSGGLGALALIAVLAFRLGRRRGALVASAVLCVAATASTARADGGKKQRTRILVMGLNATYGVDPKISEVITNRLTAQVQAITGAQVFSTADVQAQLGLVRAKALVGCRDDQCMAEIGGALGADLMVTGSLAKVGSSISFDAEVMDTAKSQVLRRYSHRIKGASEDDFFDEADRAVAALFPQELKTPTVLQAAKPAEPIPASAEPPTASTTTQPVEAQVISTDEGSGWLVGLSGASELTAKGGWGSVEIERRFSRTVSAGVEGLFTGAKNAGAALTVDVVPLWQDSVVRPVLGLETPVLFDDHVLLAVAPRVGVAWQPLALLSFELDVPVVLLLNANDDERAIYLAGRASAQMRF